jgi:DNA-binding NarL/FixJ family response regulator
MERRLTERQQRIVELIAEGEDTEGVAEALGVGYYTARDLQRTLRDTLGAPRVRDIPEYARHTCAA